MPELVIVDADALIAAAFEMDRNHRRVKPIITKLTQKKIQRLYPLTAIGEAVKVLHRKKQSCRAAQSVIELAKNGFKVGIIEYIDKDIFSEAIARFETFDLKANPGDTLFDAIVATIAIRRGAAVFSFDDVYKRLGLQLAEDLFP